MYGRADSWLNAPSGSCWNSRARVQGWPKLGEEVVARDGGQEEADGNDITEIKVTRLSNRLKGENYPDRHSKCRHSMRDHPAHHSGLESDNKDGFVRQCTIQGSSFILLTENAFFVLVLSDNFYYFQQLYYFSLR